MIERQTIDGRKATVSYLGPGFQPVDEADADCVKVAFDDGEVAFLVPERRIEALARFAGVDLNKYSPDQPRDDHGRWSGGGSVYPSIKTDMTRGLAKNETALQPVKNLDELYDRAKAAEPQFKADVENAAKAVGGKAVFTPAQYAEPGTTLKSRTSAERKMKSELNNDPTQLRDVLRGSVVTNDVLSARQAASQFIGDHQDDILRVKDRFTNPVSGYRDILINYRTPDGLVAEVQFGAQNMIDTKNGEGHALYEQMRVLPAAAAHGGGSASEQYRLLDAQQTALYNRAYEADGNGRGWRT